MPNDNDNTVQPITDDAELAKVLDGMKTDPNGGLSFEESPTTPGPQAAPAPDVATQAAPAPQDTPVAPVPPMPQPDAPAQASPELDSIKRSALEELRPLVDKLELPSDEKFDTLLLIIRSTDDQSLVSQAYDAAKAIEDDTKRAQALLDIIKEIDYFANPQHAQQ